MKTIGTPKGHDGWTHQRGKETTTLQNFKRGLQAIVSLIFVQKILDFFGVMGGSTLDEKCERDGNF